MIKYGSLIADEVRRRNIEWLNNGKIKERRGERRLCYDWPIWFSEDFKKTLETFRIIAEATREIEEKASHSLLNKVIPKGIISSQTLQEQKFSEIKWTEGEKFGDVLSRIQKRSEKP